MVLKEFFFFRFRLVFLPTTLALLPPGEMLLSVLHREIALPISKKHPEKACLSSERPNRSIVKIQPRTLSTQRPAEVLNFQQSLEFLRC